MGNFTRSCILFVLCLSTLGSVSGCDHGGCIISEVCKETSDCMAGLVCSSNCTNSPRCLRAQSFDVAALNQSLPFNKYAWLTTHNSFAITNSTSQTGTTILTFTNQEDSVTEQLNNGVRGLMLDMYDFRNDIWLCHSFGGQCQDITAFQPAINTLNEVEAFLSANPTAVITIFIEDYVRTANGLTNLFRKADLMKYWFPVSRMPKDGSAWPTLSDMISTNQRLVVFTSSSSKEANEGIAYQWRYAAENEYGDIGLQRGQCKNRGESPPLSDRRVSLLIQNYFPSNPEETQACIDNSQPLSEMLKSCYTAAGQRWANFLAVDFYKRSTGGGSFHAVDVLNGNLMCGCGDVHECQTDLTPGACNTTNTPRVAENNADDSRPTSTDDSPRPQSVRPSSSAPRVGISFMITLVSALLGSWVILGYY